MRYQRCVMMGSEWLYSEWTVNDGGKASGRKAIICKNTQGYVIMGEMMCSKQESN